jgi:hypothetical protein
LEGAPAATSAQKTTAMLPINDCMAFEVFILRRILTLTGPGIKLVEMLAVKNWRLAGDYLRTKAKRNSL